MPFPRYSIDLSYMYNLLSNVYWNDLQIDPELHPLIITVPPKYFIEPLVQLLAENFRVPSLHITTPAQLTLLKTGRRTGIVLDCGFEETYIVPIYEGHIIQHAISTLPFGGKDITALLEKLLYAESFLTVINNYHVIREFNGTTASNDIKESICYVATDFFKELCSCSTVPYEMPNGIKVQIGNERFKCTELLFQPSLIGMSICGIHDAVYNSIMKCQDSELINELFNNIILSGGSTQFPGFKERLHQELSYLSNSRKIDIIDEKCNKEYAAWIGGSMLGSRSNFEMMCMKYDEYDEHGPKIIHRT